MLVYGTFVLKRWFRLAQPGPATDCRCGSDLSRASAGEGSAMAGPAQLVEPQICIVIGFHSKVWTKQHLDHLVFRWIKQTMCEFTTQAS